MIRPSPKMLLILTAIAVPGGLLLLLFPKQATNFAKDVKERWQRCCKAER